MNTEIDKKWFVYVGDHHEGPFSLKEVSDKKKSGQVSDESYVWCEGMDDWLMMSRVPELKSDLSVTSESKTSSQKGSGKKPATPGKNGPGFLSRFSKKQKRTFGLVIGTLGIFALGVFGLAALSQVASDELHSKLRPALTRVSDSAPFLSGFFKLVPTLNDVKPDEQKELEQARVGAPENGVKIAVALSTNDFNRPFFYVSTNLPDRTKFDVYLIGNSETLLNKLQYSNQGTLVTNKGFGKSEVFLSEAGQLIPRGDYQVFVTESSDQDESVRTLLAQYQDTRLKTKTPTQVPANSHFLAVKTYFIGGEKDETYLTRLKSFHEKIKQNSERESLELKQYNDTLSFQFKTMTAEFTKILSSRKASPTAVAIWKRDALAWQQISAQLDQTIQTWSKETLENEFFYGKVYEYVKGAYDSMKALFTLENAYVTAIPQDRAAFDIQHGKALSETHQAIELLQTKIDFIANSPKSPSGLPTREGL